MGIITDLVFLLQFENETLLGNDPEEEQISYTINNYNVVIITCIAILAIISESIVESEKEFRNNEEGEPILNFCKYYIF